MNATRRAPIKAVNIPAAAVAKQAAAESARKAASKKALKQALAAAGDANPDGTLAAAEALTKHQEAETAARARAAEYAANALKSAQEDAALTGLPLEQILADMGLDATGHPPTTNKAGTEKPTYMGPMLALRERHKNGAYVKGANGNPHAADALGNLCGQYPREVVVQGLIRALRLEHNPYSHLNPGQQSMNLRNKARAALKAQTLTIGEVTTALALTA